MEEPQDPKVRIRQERERLKLTRGKLIRRARELLGLSQEELAQKINGAAITVSRWEREEGQGPNLFHQRHLAALIGLEVEELGYLQAGDDQASQKLWNVPFRRNPYFTAYDEVIEELHLRLSAEKDGVAIETLSGLGGIGKTQLMLEYAYRKRDDYRAVFWFRADKQELLEEDLAQAAKLLGVPEARKRQPNHQYLVNEAKQWLQKHSDWLLLIDNVEEGIKVKDLLLGMQHGHVLLTSRSQAVAELARNLRLDKMQPEEGALLLLRRAQLLPPTGSLDTLSYADRQKALELSRLLDGLPLALDQAGAYIGETDCSLSGYIQEYHTHRKDLLHWRSNREKLYSDYAESVATTWLISFNRVNQQCPAATKLLYICAFLHPDAIPESILLAGTLSNNSLSHPIVENTLQLNQACEVLLRYSLIRRNTTETLISIHRLVQAVLQDRMDEPTQRLWGEQTVYAVAKAFASAPVQYAERYIPHARLCSKLIKQWNLTGKEVTELLERAANAVDERGWYALARPLYLRAYNASLDLRGEEDPHTIDLLLDIGRVHMILGVNGWAKDHYERVWKKYEQLLGPNDPLVVTCLNNQALAEIKMSSFWDAARTVIRALEWHERMQRQDSAELAMTYQVAGKVSAALSRDDLAETYYSLSLEIRERLFGREHPEVANSLAELGVYYRDRDELDRAEALLEETLTIRMNNLGYDHPDTASCMENLAILRRKQGDFVKAEKLCREALAIRRQKLGLYHPDIAQNLYGLALLALDQGKDDEAESLFREGVGVYQRAGEFESLGYAFLLLDYAEFLRDRGRVDEADTYEREVASACERLEREENVSTYALSTDDEEAPSTYILVRRRHSKPMS